jgi:hypothetical protein
LQGIVPASGVPNYPGHGGYHANEVQQNVRHQHVEGSSSRGWQTTAQAHIPTPYTLHPTPYTLHPTPYTLHPTPYTLHPTPYTLRL